MIRRRALIASPIALLARPALAQGDAARVLRFVPQADVSVVDPLNTTSYAVRNHGHLCWDTLYGIDEAGRTHPQLAEGHSVEDDGRRWVFTLRSGPVFHDGEPVRAADAVASIRRWMARDTHGQTLAARLEEIRVLDDRRFEMRLRQAFGAMLDALGKSSSYPCFVMPARLANTPPLQAMTEVVGSGPYRFLAAERRAGDRAVYLRHERYSPAPGGPVSVTAGPKIASFERLEWRILPDPATTAAALQTGEVDWWERVAPDLRPVLQRRRDVVVDRIEGGGTIGMLRPNHLHPPFDDPAVRRALLPALDQTEFMQAIMGDDRTRFRTGVGPFTPGSPMASDVGMEALTGPRSLERARQMLAATGKAGAKVVTLNPADQINNATLTTVAVDLMRKVGLDAEAATSDWSTMLARRARKEPPAQGGWNAVFVAFGGEDLTNPGGHPLLRGNGGDAWFGWPTSPRLEALRNDWFEAADDAGQRRVGAEINRVFFEDVPYWPLGQFFVESAYRRGLRPERRGLSLPLNVRREA
jgi:peptide/nickel transport system substrate-binding protein